MPEYRNGDWIMTCSGVHFYPLDPRPNEIRLTDIAHALSQICRYTGHTSRHYSVAEHAIMVAMAVPPEMQLVALHHDDSEAYLSDISRPMKPFISRYGEIEANLMRAIAGKFGFVWPMPAKVQEVDTAMLADEGASLLPEPEFWVTRYGPGTGREITGLSAPMAEMAFLYANSFVRNGGDLRALDIPSLLVRADLLVHEIISTKTGAAA